MNASFSATVNAGRVNELMFNFASSQINDELAKSFFRFGLTAFSGDYYSLFHQVLFWQKRKASRVLSGIAPICKQLG